VLTDGMGGNAATALSYILLGAFAVGLARSGLGEILSKKLSAIPEGRKLFMVFSLAFISIFSQNLIPIHIAFIPILIPPLLGLMNKLMIDLRAISVAL
ncbi:sodium:proton antiporter, partial [Salmonella enterica subsp. enterica serovar Enteritidis]